LDRVVRIADEHHALLLGELHCRPEPNTDYLGLPGHNSEPESTGAKTQPSGASAWKMVGDGKGRKP
jgi:hypothetical protein